MREIDEILSTDDGSHVMVLCTDGGVMHCQKHFAEDINVSQAIGASSDVSHCHSELVEVPGLQRDINSDQAWVIRSVGLSKETVIVRASKTNGVVVVFSDYLCGEMNVFASDLINNFKQSGLVQGHFPLHQQLELTFEDFYFHHALPVFPSSECNDGMHYLMFSVTCSRIIY